MLDHRKIATVIVGHDEPEGGGQDDVLTLAEDLQNAVKHGSPQDVADAFQALFMCCEAKPHDEADHDSY